MHAVWVFLKDTVNCGVKVTDVVGRTGTCGNNRSYCTEMDSLGFESVRNTGTPLHKVTLRQKHPRTLLYALNLGDPSRNIVEMILQRASMNPLNPSRKIKTVLKVKNSVEVLERFEKYREKVKKKVYNQYETHPRSKVDGNELLRFYSTTIVCCSGKSKRIYEFCKDPTCDVCRIIQSNFDTDYTRRYGVRLSTSSEELSENMIATTSGKNMKMAVIVCRTIAGSVVTFGEGDNEDFDSVGSGLLSNLECLTVRNPDAVLPCFVVVFD